MKSSMAHVRLDFVHSFRDRHGKRRHYFRRHGFKNATLPGQVGSAEFMDAYRRAVKIAMRIGLRADDPTAGILIKTRDRGGWRTWNEDEITQFEAVYPIGTRERLAFALLLYTGQRRGDVIRMGRQHVKSGFLTVRQGKTGATIAIPIHSALQAILASSDARQMTFDDRDRQAFRPRRLHQLVWKRGARRRSSAWPERPWPAQGDVHKTCRGRMLGKSGRGDFRPCDMAGSPEIYQGGQSKAVGDGGDGTN
jgi:integrase